MAEIPVDKEYNAGTKIMLSKTWQTNFKERKPKTFRHDESNEKDKQL